MESSGGVFVTGYDLNRPLANDLQVRTLKRGIILFGKCALSLLFAYNKGSVRVSLNRTIGKFTIGVVGSHLYQW